MDQEGIERIVRSTVHIYVAAPITHEPKGLGSGCVINFYGTEVLLTVAHVTDKDDAGTCILTGRDREMYAVGDMQYMDRFDMDKYEKQIKELKNKIENKEEIDFGQIDFSCVSLVDKADFDQRQTEFTEFTIAQSEKLVVESDLTCVPDKSEEYAFFGRIKSEFFKGTLQGDVFETQEVFYGGLKYIKKVGCYYEFELPNVIHDHTDFQGTSGAPIMDANGKVVSLVTHGYTGGKRIYGIALSDFKSGVEAMILSDKFSAENDDSSTN